MQQRSANQQDLNNIEKAIWGILNDRTKATFDSLKIPEAMKDQYRSQVREKLDCAHKFTRRNELIHMFFSLITNEARNLSVDSVEFRNALMPVLWAFRKHQNVPSDEVDPNNIKLIGEIMCMIGKSLLGMARYVTDCLEIPLDKGVKSALVKELIFEIIPGVSVVGENIPQDPKDTHLQIETGNEKLCKLLRNFSLYHQRMLSRNRADRKRKREGLDSGEISCQKPVLLLPKITSTLSSETNIEAFIKQDNEQLKTELTQLKAQLEESRAVIMQLGVMLEGQENILSQFRKMNSTAAQSNVELKDRVIPRQQTASLFTMFSGEKKAVSQKDQSNTSILLTPNTNGYNNSSAS